MPAKKKPSTATRRPANRRAKERTPPTPDADTAQERAPFTSPAFTPGTTQDCLMCPFGIFFFTMRQARPEAMEHLTAAGYELFQAFRAVVEQAGERWEQSQSLQRITVR